MIKNKHVGNNLEFFIMFFLILVVLHLQHQFAKVIRVCEPCGYKDSKIYNQIYSFQKS